MKAQNATGIGTILDKPQGTELATIQDSRRFAENFMVNGAHATQLQDGCGEKCGSERRVGQTLRKKELALGDNKRAGLVQKKVWKKYVVGDSVRMENSRGWRHTGIGDNGKNKNEDNTGLDMKRGWRAKEGRRTKSWKKKSKN